MTASTRNAGRWFAILLTALGPTLAAVAYTHGPANAQWAQIIYFSSKVLLFLFPVAWWQLVEKRRALAVADETALQTTDRPAGRARNPATRWDIALGAGTGLLIAASIWSAYLLVFRDVIDAETLRRKVIEFGAYDHYILFAGFLAIVNSGLEEYYWRWFVFGRLQREVGSLPATVLSAVAFSAHHFVVLQDFLGSTSQAALFSVGIAVGGVLWACHYNYARRLRGVWLSHLIVDLAVLSVGYHLLFETP